MMRSDHAPILTMLNSTHIRTNKPFRFENWWLKEQDYQVVAKHSWLRSETRSLADKTHFLAADLRKWRRKKPKLKDQLEVVEQELLKQQMRPPHQQDYDLQQHLTQQHHQLLLKDEEFHLQRAKKNWATQGDRNTSYFHQAIVKRNRKNRITYLCNPDGSHSTTPEQLANTKYLFQANIFIRSCYP